MTSVKLYEAKTNLSQLVDAANQGEEFIITKGNKPMARLVPLEEKKPNRKLGLLKGKIFISDDFDDESEEINEMFYGSDN